MAAAFEFRQDYGVKIGSRGKHTIMVTSNDFKSVDDGTTAYDTAPVVAGQNSYSVWQFGYFTGTFNRIFNCRWSPHTSPAGALATGLTLHAQTSGFYFSPATTADHGMLGDPRDFTTAVPIGGALVFGGPLPILFGASSPASGFPDLDLTANPGCTLYLVSQLQTTTSASPGDITTIIGTLQYDEE